MKIFRIPLMIACLLLSTAGCQQKSHEHDHGPGHAHEEEDAGTNQTLYDEVMGIHDEVMPKMNDLYKRKTALKTRLALPDLSEREKQDITHKISRIDSASESMMVWMRQFDPVPDSEGEEKARAYLTDELAKVKKVREDILEALASTE